MKYILIKLTSTNLRLVLEFDSHTALMSHFLRMMKEEPGASVVSVSISPI